MVDNRCLTVETESSLIRRLFSLSLVLGCLAVPLLVHFFPVLFQDQQFAFRDAGNYYYPLVQRVQQEWDAGRLPLWTPEASAGMPLLGNPTAAVLYPGKIVFFLLPFPWAMRVFLVGHVALAFGTMVGLLRGLNVSRTGSVLGALSYAFGVPVLTQTSNMIFLVGAAWTPLGFLAADRWVRGGHRLALAGLAVVLALQVLGGDPEAAYVTWISAAGYALGIFVSKLPWKVSQWLPRVVAVLAATYLFLLGLSWWWAKALQDDSEPGSDASGLWLPPKRILVVIAWVALAGFLIWKARQKGGIVAGFSRMLGGLVGGAAIALAMVGAQLLPILEYSGESFRAADAEGFHDIYPYSAHPLQLLSAVWPSFSGTLEGGYRSWLNALPPKPGSRLWMPSIYLSGLTLVLAAAGFGLRNGPPWRAWFSALAIISLLASLGYYGSPLLWARCVPGWEAFLGPLEPAFSWKVRTDGHLRDGDGGVYWFLASAFPGFDSFRYPPKLFVYWSLAMSALAALGWDRVVQGQSRWAKVLAGGLLFLGLFALTVFWLDAAPLRSWFESLAEELRLSDEPLDVTKALEDIRNALLQGTIFAALALGVVLWASKRSAKAWVGAVAVGVMAFDLCLANAYHIVTVPQAAFEQTPRALEVIQEAERLDPSPGPFRVQRVGQWSPQFWFGSATSRDFEGLVRWQRDTLRPHYNLPLGVPSTFFLDTLEPLDYGLFFLPWLLEPDLTTVQSFGLEPGQKVWYYPRRGFDLWNTRYFIVPAQLVWESVPRGYAAFVPRSTFLYPKLGAFEGPEGEERRADWEATEDFRVLRNESAFPRAWVVHRAYVMPEIQGKRIADRQRVMQGLIYQGDEFWRLPGVSVRDPRAIAWVETSRPDSVEPYLSRVDPDPSETVEVTLDEPQRVELTAVLKSPGLVVVADQFYPGWKVSVDGQPAEILRTNRAMRGVALPAGTHQLVFRYEPLSFQLGLVLSVLGLTALLSLIGWAWRKPIQEVDNGELPMTSNVES